MFYRARTGAELVRHTVRLEPQADLKVRRIAKNNKMSINHVINTAVLEYTPPSIPEVVALFCRQVGGKATSLLPKKKGADDTAPGENL